MNKLKVLALILGLGFGYILGQCIVSVIDNIIEVSDVRRE